MVSNENPKQVVFAQFAAVAKHLLIRYGLKSWSNSPRASDTRGGGEPNPCVDRQCLAHHQHLRRAGLITARRDCGVRLPTQGDDAVLELVASVRRVAEQHSAEVQRVLHNYFDDRDSLEPVSRLELMNRLKAGLVTVLDVRPEDEFCLAHLPGAINIPLGELDKRLADLDPDQKIVAYCRGPYCVLSYEAVAVLRARGFNVRRLEDGLPEWRTAGLPVAFGPD